MEALGPKVFFPSAVFTLIRSGIKRPANELTFRVPRYMTKLDIKAYLEGLYGSKVTGVETTTFLGRLELNGKKRGPTKKNAVVTFEPRSMGGFKWPDPPSAEDLKFPAEPAPKPPRFYKK
jgi:ribosomal protein L23